jgi:transcriptional regulator with XRE-family HTH domain
VTETFATVFRRACRSARHPERGRPLTQERFAELLGRQLRSASTMATTVSNWERGRTQPHRHQTLHAVVTVLLRCNGLTTVDQANELLRCGGYAPLSQEEFGDGAMPPTRSQPDTTVVGDQNGAIPSDAQDSMSRKLFAIRHQSMEQIPPSAIRAWLPADLRECEYIEITIDQCDLFHNGRLIDPYEAARHRHPYLLCRPASACVRLRPAGEQNDSSTPGDL